MRIELSPCQPACLVGEPLDQSCAIVLHLHIRVLPENRGALLGFLQQARAFYEQPGGIRMKLLQDNEDLNSFVEVFEYETIEAYQADEQRVMHDPVMKAFLTTWRGLLAGPPSVQVYADASEVLHDPREDVPG
jgi:quinol monooxygenase YgiN